MKILIDMAIQFWYLWTLILFFGILQIFMPKIKGFFGEKSVAFFLSMLDKDKYKILNNVMLEINGKTTQIDHVVVSNYGIFVIETKNYKGWILGNEYEDYWTQVIYKRKEKLYNPIKQNYGHVQALREHLKDFPSINMHSIIVFTTKADLKVKTNTDVIYTINLPKTIKKYSILENVSDTVKNEICSKLLSLNVDSKENRKKHIDAIHENKASIKNKIDSDICPKCGSSLVLRNGKYGQFRGCSAYPKCRYILK